MVAVYISVRHDDDFVITQLVDIKANRIFIIAECNASSKGANNHLHRLIIESLINTCLLDTDDFSKQWQNCLGGTVTALLCRATSRVTFDKIDLRLRGTSFSTVSKLSWKA